MGFQNSSRLWSIWKYNDFDLPLVLNMTLKVRQSHFNKVKIHLLPDTQLSESSYTLLKFEVQLDLLLFYYD